MNESPKPPMALALPFTWAGMEGEARVEIRANDDPAALGCRDFARGFPVCRATIAPPATGYSDMLGWIQIVDDSYHGDGFHADGFEPLGHLPHPFGFYGVSPTLFDAPHADAESFDFVAHTFLCGLGGELLEFRQEARAVLGFGWGCRKRGPEIELFDPEPLPAAAWDGHREYLASRFPDWTFSPGYFQHPLER
ncbi:MAG TPA: hypothetical protein VFJ76_03960 [Solirubrobacterales bacterium]|nr:hypothetical protein [Solirubrobacterales bacterium]